MVEKKTRKEERVFVVGNGMTKFLKPGKHGFDYHDLSEIAIRRALRDAGIVFEKVEQAFVGYVYGDSCAG
jgi:acetyl-CoA acetyltransferase